MKQIKRVRWALAIAALLLMSTPIPQAYTIKATKWNTSQVPFYVNTTNLDVDESAALAAVQFGAYAWTNQTNAAFSFVYAGSTNGSSATNNGKNEIFFRDASNGSAIATHVHVVVRKPHGRYRHRLLGRRLHFRHGRFGMLRRHVHRRYRHSRIRTCAGPGPLDGG